MKYTNDCVEKFKKDILRLFERLHSLHIKIEEKGNCIKSKKEGSSIKMYLDKLIDQSCSFEKLAMNPSALENDIERRSESFLQFDSFFKDEKSKQYKKVNIFVQMATVTN